MQVPGREMPKEWGLVKNVSEATYQVSASSYWCCSFQSVVCLWRGSISIFHFLNESNKHSLQTWSHGKLPARSTNVNFPCRVICSLGSSKPCKSCSIWMESIAWLRLDMSLRLCEAMARFSSPRRQSRAVFSGDLSPSSLSTFFKNG